MEHKHFSIKPSRLADWQKDLENNTDPYGRRCFTYDPYGRRCFTYAADWASLMEARLCTDSSVADVANETSRQADTNGITGFMYGCAVSILAHVWEHGEELRQCHNLDTQLSDEGKRANESGGVLNPALLTIG
jgi:hypothetical protein